MLAAGTVRDCLGFPKLSVRPGNGLAKGRRRIVSPGWAARSLSDTRYHNTTHTMQIGQFIESVFETIKSTGARPASVRFQINFDHHEFGSGIEVVSARITADHVPFPVPGVAEDKGNTFGIDFTIPVRSWGD